MGEVAARIRVMPESTDVDLVKLGEALRRAVPANARLHAMEERPIAFGLRALIAVVILGDTSGGTEEAEVAFARVPGVESVEVEEVGLL